MFIYRIKNTITGRCYVGQTKRPIEKRLKSHISEAKQNKYGMYLHNSIRKHGADCFTVELLEECDKEVVCERERFWIKELNTKEPNGYNEHEGGYGGCLNPSPELRKKLSDAKKGHTPWNKGKKGLQTAWNKGLTKSDSRIANYINSMMNTKKKKRECLLD